MSDEKKEILDVRIPKEEQKKLLSQKKYADILRVKKYQVNILTEGRVRYLYGDDPEILQDYAKSIGAKILKVVKL